MRPQVPPNDKCPQGSKDACPLTCKYNHFESDEFTIDAWELKCLDCGWRETIGYRSDELDEEELDDDFDPKRCPFCKLCDLAPGKSPCEGK
ncbi:MAG: hypothetical protein AAFN77_17820 [Planctomycetota bacterium]